MSGASASVVSQAPSLASFTVHSSSRIATLWANYGSIDRVYLRGNSAPASIIIKTVKPPPLLREETADEGRLRKLLSYEVEQYFYSHLSSRLPSSAKVALFHPTQPRHEDSEEIDLMQIVLEDLSIEYPNPARGSLDHDDTWAVLSWLATFHGIFWGIERDVDIQLILVPPPLQYKGGNKGGIWKQGTYWYLDTRREELDFTDEQEHEWLLKWVERVDAAMKQEARAHGTLLHGDVKGANIVFSRPSQSSTPEESRSSRCAVYDFQYAGLGLGTRDLVYFLGTTAQSGLLRNVDQEKALLRVYHEGLMQCVESRRERADGIGPVEDYTFEMLWGHWELAIVDWCRFMAGWGFWGNSTWVSRRAREIVSRWKTGGFPFS